MWSTHHLWNSHPWNFIGKNWSSIGKQDTCKRLNFTLANDASKFSLYCIPTTAAAKVVAVVVGSLSCWGSTHFTIYSVLQQQWLCYYPIMQTSLYCLKKLIHSHTCHVWNHTCCKKCSRNQKLDGQVILESYIETKNLL